MPITILTGMPGAGESKPLITTVKPCSRAGTCDSHIRGSGLGWS